MIKTSELQDGFKILNKGRGVKNLNYIVIESSTLYLINYQHGDTAVINLGRTHLQDNIYKINSNINEIQKGLKYFKDHSVISELENGSLIFKSGRKIVVVEIEESEMNLELSNEYTKEFKFDFEDFKVRLESVVPLKGKDKARPMLSGIHFNNNHIVALDGFRLAMNIDNTTSNKLDPMTLTGTTTDYLVDILKIIKNSDDITVKYKEGTVEFEIDNVKLISTLYDGEYFNYQDIIRSDSDDTTTIENVNIKKLLDDIKFIESMSEHGRIIDGQIRGYSKDEYNNFRIKNKVDLQYEIEGEDIDISFNVKYMRDILNALRKLDETTTLGFKDSLGPIFFRNKSSIYLLLPIRLAY